MKNLELKSAHTDIPPARLKIITGPHKGDSYKLVGEKITIGRSKTNDIVLSQDERCSRRQALVVWENGGYIVRDLSKRSSLKVNDHLQVVSTLRQGDVISVGNSEMEMILNTPSQNPAFVTPSSKKGELPSSPPPIVKGGVLASLPAPAVGQALSLNSPPPQSVGGVPPPGGGYTPPLVKKKKSLKPKIILVGVVILGAYLFTSDEGKSPSQKRTPDSLPTIEDKENTIKSLKDLKKEAQKKHQKSKTKDFQSAQFAYVTGIRDYRKGVYVRAAQAFRACKTIYPRHPLCGSYLKKSQIKQAQLVQAWMTSGKSYRQKRRFMACMSSFKNVLQAIKNPKNPTYREAKENYKICAFEKEKGRY